MRLCSIYFNEKSLILSKNIYIIHIMGKEIFNLGGEILNSFEECLYYIYHGCRDFQLKILHSLAFLTIQTDAYM